MRVRVDRVLIYISRGPSTSSARSAALPVFGDDEDDRDKKKRAPATSERGGEAPKKKTCYFEVGKNLNKNTRSRGALDARKKLGEVTKSRYFPHPNPGSRFEIILWGGTKSDGVFG